MGGNQADVQNNKERWSSVHFWSCFHFLTSTSSQKGSNLSQIWAPKVKNFSPCNNDLIMVPLLFFIISLYLAFIVQLLLADEEEDDKAAVQQNTERMSHKYRATCTTGVCTVCVFWRCVVQWRCSCRGMEGVQQGAGAEQRTSLWF